MEPPLKYESEAGSENEELEKVRCRNVTHISHKRIISDRNALTCRQVILHCQQRLQSSATRRNACKRELLRRSFRYGFAGTNTGAPLSLTKNTTNFAG